MVAAEFNRRWPVGTAFMHMVLRDVRIVKTVSQARDFKCGCVVEINREPYFVKVETLKYS
ncbi:hypothetical protein GM30_06630 [Trabulsiella odontotermitis]|nr:hypothetical protein [Trabulsiella odontotermitis]KNC89687.1 hypothetical protein GM30_06630 [Trabulsiella odontotermitis]